MTKELGRVPWPWIGVLVLVAVLAHELVLRISAGQNDMLLAGWRILTMTIGVASLGLLIMPDWRRSYLLGALVCTYLLTQHRVKSQWTGLERVAWLAGLTLVPAVLALAGGTRSAATISALCSRVYA